MKVRFWGVRGSIPVPGDKTSRYGGNSSCIEISVDGQPPLVLDCGTGARSLGRELVLRHEPDIYALFTHFHMDHLFGLPFFAPLYSPSCTVHVSVPAYSGIDAQNKLGRYLNGIYHPIRIQDVAGKMTFDGIRPSRPFAKGPYDITAVALNHPGGSLGYRVTCGGHTVVYLTDTAPLARPGEGLLSGKLPPAPEARVMAAMQGADLLIMDTMFSWEEYLEKMTWGHCYPEYAVRLAEETGVKRVALFHHAPDAEDDDLDALGERWASHDGVEVFLAREGAIVDLEG